MSITLSDIDGKYIVYSETSDGGPFTVKGDGMTEIKNGQTYRKDDKGCIWESAFSVLNDDEIQIESTVDPSHAPGDIYIKDENGNPTKGMITYRSVLKAKVVEGKIVMDGEIRHGSDVTRLTMKQV